MVFFFSAQATAQAAQLDRLIHELDNHEECIYASVTSADTVYGSEVVHNLLQNAQDACEGRSDASVTVLTRWVEASRRVRLSVRDNGPGLPRGWSLERHVGIGLGNTRARLEQLYGMGEFSLEVAPDEQRRTCVDIMFPFRVA